MLGYKPGQKTHDIFWDKVEDICGFYMIQREISKAVNGQSFFINNEDTKKPEYYEPIDYTIFIYYYNLWENFHYFGLPHGKGWIDEREWLLNFLKVFENAYNVVQNFIELKGLKT